MSRPDSFSATKSESCFSSKGYFRRKKIRRLAALRLSNNSAGNRLKDRVSGRVKHGVKPGPKPYLHTEEEGELSSFFEDMCHCRVW